MRLFITIITAIAMSALACGLAILVDNKVVGKPYALTTEVVEVNIDNDTVTCEDSKGHLWRFYGTEDWAVGDCASLLMNDHGTPSVYDDTVKSAHYNEWMLIH